MANKAPPADKAAPTNEAAKGIVLIAGSIALVVAVFRSGGYRHSPDAAAPAEQAPPVVIDTSPAPQR